MNHRKESFGFTEKNNFGSFKMTKIFNLTSCLPLSCCKLLSKFKQVELDVKHFGKDEPSISSENLQYYNLSKFTSKNVKFFKNHNFLRSLNNNLEKWCIKASGNQNTAGDFLAFLFLFIWLFCRLISGREKKGSKVNKSDFFFQLQRNVIIIFRYLA